MANVKISQLTPKGANLASTDLLEISEFDGSGYVTKSVTGQDIIDAAASSGGVTDVTATAPLASSGGTTPDISIPQADAGSDGYLTSTDYISFTNKQDLLVSATNIKTINGSSVLGSGDLVVSGGGGGVHAVVKPSTGQVVSASLTGANLNTIFGTANRLTAQPFIPANTFTCANLYLNVSSFASGALARILIYSDLNGIPNTKLYESANLDCSTNGIKTATTTFTFTAGTTYWICTHASSGSGFTSFTTNSVISILISGTSNIASYIYTYTFGSAPTTLTGQGNSVTAIPAVFITSA